ncbi:MAG: ion channel [Eudoraea sp.]|uniref:ion channel n=1 Tax=Eudoraea sp. TaxID=1979955 RepID=UPI003C75C16B
MLETIANAIKDKDKSAVLLLLTCFTFVFIMPVFEFPSNIFSIILFSLILFLASYPISRKVMFIGFVAILIELATRATDFIYVQYLAQLTTNLFIIFLVSSVVRHMMNQKNVTIYTLVNALNGYLLLGIMFMSLVAFCHLYLPGSFNASGKSDMELVYYTLITLTTAGYGDITPQLPLSQSLAMLIAVTGQFYVAVVVAILVGKYSSSVN